MKKLSLLLIFTAAIVLFGCQKDSEVTLDQDNQVVPEQKAQKIYFEGRCLPTETGVTNCGEKHELPNGNIKVTGFQSVWEDVTTFPPWPTGAPSLLTSGYTYWNEDMIWWGPGGIGAPYTQQRYLEQHCVPFEEGLKWGDFFGHRTEFAEGHYGGFFGWPTFDVTSLGGYIGLAPKSDKKASMRVVDLYRREGEKLAENWNFIDHLHFLEQLGVDLVARQRMLTGLD